jgi:hypothetical protein
MVTLAPNIAGYAHYVVGSHNVGDTIDLLGGQYAPVSFTVVDFELPTQERLRELCAVAPIHQMNVHFRTSRRGDALSGAILDMVDALITASGIRTLFLDFSASETKIGNVGASILSGLGRLRSTHLHSLKLDLSDNDIDGRGAVALTFTLSRLTTMSLNLNHNQITGNAVIYLVVAMEHMFENLGLKVLWLGLADNNLDEESLHGLIAWKNFVRSSTQHDLFLNITGNPGLTGNEISAKNRGYPLLHWDENEWDAQRDASFHR